MVQKRRASNELPNTRQGNPVSMGYLGEYNENDMFLPLNDAELNYGNEYVTDQNNAGLCIQQGQYIIPSQNSQHPYRQDPQQYYVDPTVSSSRRLSDTTTVRSKQKSKSNTRTHDMTGSEQIPPSRPIEIAFSILEKDFPDLEYPDIEEIVHRSVEVRRAEKLNRPLQRPKRPMNPFILYRKKYRLLAKQLRDLKNEQNVSKAVTDGWKLETVVVKEQYQKWADTDKELHEIAHPEFKNGAKRSGVVKGKKKEAAGRNKRQTGRGKARGTLLHDVSDRDSLDYLPEDIDDFPLPDPENDLHEYDWREGTLRRKRVAQPGFGAADAGMAASFLYGSQGQSGYGHSNPGMVPPVQYDASNLSAAQYLQQTSQPGRQSGTEDVTVRLATRPGFSPDGLPQRPIYSIQDQHPYVLTDHNKSPLDFPDNIDPSLTLGEYTWNEEEYAPFDEEFDFGAGIANSDNQQCDWAIGEDAEENADGE